MNTASDNAKAQDGLRTQAILMLGLLVIQYALGILTNLYVQFPNTDQPDQLWAVARSQFSSAAHIVLGLLVLVGAVVFVIRAARKSNRGWLASAVIGLIGIIIAIYGGVTFTTTQAAAYSLVMALGFIASLVAYGWGLYAAMR
jgi:heme A synthase